ncbi:radical SAM family heme chaperone HemW [Teredinibacter franksiae]|uniref:radical SAM family heme chaperone HemW n=1 Tax=Teredinibacter franksiae TaxID=2761453 RepID=UPI0016253A9E|nr:radical SAM family heme chaperone HemW [Teredinibacter franksiae]
MPNFTQSNLLPPLALYVHIPWCVRKCPYCDFNSHQVRGELPIDDYVKATVQDLALDAHLACGRQIESIFFGGGTPSLMPAAAIDTILEAADTKIGLSQNCEITLEANPGTAEYHNFQGYRQAGVNRLSIGVQSFNADHLQQLGRIHNPEEVDTAYALARKAGFDNINLDLMFALPEQTVEQAQNDLQHAIALEPEHLSWYQLTIEPNTEFYSRPPQVPSDDLAWDIQQAGREQLADAGFDQYEVSAYSTGGRAAKHNVNYWQFGDYLAIGAGAHGKITLPGTRSIIRLRKTRLPEHYLAAAIKHTEGNPFTVERKVVSETDLPFEFLMNGLRLTQGVPAHLFSQRTGLPLALIEPKLNKHRRAGSLVNDPTRLATTALGHQFLNSLLEDFLDP